jgi:hypothetical protein
MDARKATAAVSAAGIILIAGCGGGGKMGGGSLPSTQNGSGLHSNTQPANSSRVGMKFAIPRTATAWTTAVRTAYKARRSKAFTPTKARRSMVSSRKPQFISQGLVGGSISIFIYQGTSLALTQGPFTAGTTYGAYDFYCAYNPVAAEVLCTNYTPVFAPYGSDTFYVAMYNSANQLLSITPGMPGTNFVQATQPAYTITSSGYASPISIQTYAVASYMALDAPTSCLDPGFEPNEAAAFLMDAAGYPISGPLANPFTVSTTGNFALYSLYDQQVSTPYTIYNAYGAFSEFAFVAPSTGTAGSVSVSSAGASVGINFGPSTMSLYTVDRLAVTPSTSGLNVVGLVDSTASTYACGKLPMGNYATGTPITSFSNPVAIGEDDYIPGVGVLDSVSGSPYLSLVDLNRLDFGLFLEEFGGPVVDEVPVSQVAVAGHNPLALAPSPSSGVGSGNIYILNADGSIQVVNDYNSFGATSTLEPSGTITGPVDITNLWNQTNGQAISDYVFATSSNSSNLFEIENANSSPSLDTISLAGQGGLVTPTTYAVSADNIDNNGYLSFLAFDAGNSNARSLVTCLVEFCEFSSTEFSATATLGAGQTTFNYAGASLYGLVANGNDIAPYTIQVFSSPQPTSAPLPAFGSAVTQVTTTYDGLWNGISTGGLVQFFYSLQSTVGGSIIGTYATIVSPYPMTNFGCEDDC